MADLVATLTFFLWALLSYYICDSWHGSGIVGIVVTGVMLDLYTMRHLSEVRAQRVTNRQAEEASPSTTTTR